MLLAAAVPAVPGERIIEAGLGTGAAALAVLARVPGVRAAGIEIVPQSAELARRNAELNGHAGALRVIQADIAAVTPKALAGLGLGGPFDHALANPPFFAAGAAPPPPDPVRARARIAPPGALDIWVARLADVLRRGGSLTLIHRAEALAAVLAALEGRLGGTVVLPLAARPGDAARRILVQAAKGARGPLRLMAPLVLHRADGGYTPAAEGALRHGRALVLDAADRQARP
jgi:tRNA1(Val) A37 N6-methylase TrmN6